MEEYQAYAFSVAFRAVCDEEDAKDIVQESFIRVWNNIHRYDESVKFTTWLYRIVTNLCIDLLRSGNRRRCQPLEGMSAALLSCSDPESDPERLYSNAELGAMIGTLMDDLPPKQRMIFLLRDLENLSIKEVCDILHLSEGSVKTNLVYARRYIRRRLELIHMNEP